MPPISGSAPAQSYHCSGYLLGVVTEVKTDIYVTSFGPVSDVEMVRLIQTSSHWEIKNMQISAPFSAHKPWNSSSTGCSLALGFMVLSEFTELTSWLGLILPISARLWGYLKLLSQLKSLQRQVMWTGATKKAWMVLQRRWKKLVLCWFAICSVWME